MSASSETPWPSLTGARPARLLSLDFLRGLTIAFMILVNNNGDEHLAYWPLKHAVWNGFTPTDLVFPTFLFLVGISTVFSTASRLAQGATRQSLFLHVLRRSVILFLLGLVVHSFPFFNLHTMRFYGVLPRIAICYFIIASLYILSPGWRSKAVLTVSALAAYWILMRFVPIPGYGVPTHDIPLLDRDANLTAWLDRQIFSAPHLYEHTRDPEGLLSTIPALATALLGILTGIWLRTRRTLNQKITGIATAGLTGILLGGLWNLSFPINKKLWTSSYVLFAGGLSLSLLALSLFIVDLPKKQSVKQNHDGLLKPFFIFGTNAIVAYLFSELLAATLSSIPVHPGVNLQQSIFHAILQAVPNIAFASLLYSLAFVAVCWLFVAVLYRRKIFIKI
ncbi:acyltransferase family protein [Tunturiibacter gelidiferens]|uniref:acyltransferase family protein n=1 Tax=Tunturiibacter gelidiferens TaxID=3069689 RepID=UPI003D9BE177